MTSAHEDTTEGAPSVVQSDVAKPAPTGASQLVITTGFVLITGIVVLILMVALRFLRRAADPEVHGFGKRRPTRGFEHGRSRDPWSEAGRRMVVSPILGGSDGSSTDHRSGDARRDGNADGNVDDDREPDSGAGDSDGSDGDGGGDSGSDGGSDGGGDGGGGDGGGSD